MRHSICFLWLAILSSSTLGSDFFFEEISETASRTYTEVSGDGSAAVSYLGGDTLEGYIWTASGGFQRISEPAHLDGGNGFRGVSDDGRTFLGDGYDNVDDFGENYLWSLEDGYQFLPDSAFGHDYTSVRDLSGDGKTVIGRGATGEGEDQTHDYFSWTESSGFKKLPVSEQLGAPRDVSDNGEVILFRQGVYSQPNGEVFLPDLYEGTTQVLSALSGDGSVAVGMTATNSDELYREAVRWNVATGEVQGLGRLSTYPKHDRTIAQVVSADGKLVLGDSYFTSDGRSLIENHRGFVWDERNGMRELGPILQEEYGIDLPMEINMVDAISDDRRTVVGLFGDHDMWVTKLDWPLGSIRGDSNLDDVLDASDADILVTEIIGGSTDPMFDLDGDGTVAVGDLDDYLMRANRINGDADFDGEVAFADFLTLSENFGASALWSGGDFDANGTVEFADFLILSGNFGTNAPTVASVPEPNTSVYGFVALTSGVMHCRRRKSLSCRG